MFHCALFVCVCALAVQAAVACSTQEQQLACEVLNNSYIQAAQSHESGFVDDASAYSNLQDMCAGLEARRSRYSCTACPSGAPGGTTCLSTSVLQYPLELVRLLNYRISIVELAGGCFVCNSPHYIGNALDLGARNIGVEERQGYIDTCIQMGGSARYEGNNVHCPF